MLNKNIQDLRNFQKRTFILGAGKAIFSFLLISKLYYLQILNKSKFGKLSDTNRVKIRITYPQRGVIFDSEGQKIAENRIDYQITILKEDKKFIKNNLKQLSKFLFFTKDEKDFIMKNLKKRSFDDYLIIKKNLNWDELEVFEYYSYLFPYLSINKQKVRSYNSNLAFSHVIGYVGYSKKNKDNKLQELKIGKTGFEQKYNSLLQGKEGLQKVESHASGKIVRLLQAKKSESGKNLKTYISKDLQEFCFREMKGKSGSVVVINVKTGGIVSLVSSPSFDINEFSYGIKKNTWDKLLNDPMKPLLNKCISGLYAPGSTFKLIVALLSLKESKFDPDKKVFCKGHTFLADHKFHCWKRDGHGAMNLSTALKESCDCYFYNLANFIDINKLAQISNIFSIGKKTGIDLPNELGGLMPNEKWKKENKADIWHLGETYNAVIGQGFTLSTPLQIATMISRIASGKYVKPSIIRKEESFKKLNISDNDLDFIRKSMYRAVNEFKGTAFSSRLDSKKFKMVGKTGTSQVRRITLQERESGVLENNELPYNLRDHSIFAGYAPFDSPKLAISVVLEHHGSGSKFAAPFAKKVLDFALKNKIL